MDPDGHRTAPSVRLAAEASGGDKRRSPLPVFTASWPGPGNSEGPVDPERERSSWGGPPGAEAQTVTDVEATLVATNAWPGPGNSEAARP
jgi:hypothetical protein